MSLGDPHVLETLDRILEAEGGTQAQWSALEATGLTRAWIDEALGGSGLSLADGLAIVRAAARHEADVALADTLLAGKVLELCGPDLLKQETNLAISENFRIEPEGASEAVSQLKASENSIVRILGAAVRAAQMAGALEHILERTAGYAQERSQFGRPISRFQAVQHNLAQLAGEAAAAGAAADGAAVSLEAHGPGDDRTTFAVAAAKVRCGEAASKGAMIAHQVHGAMGFTREYPLQVFTRRLWTWRDDFGSETEWAEQLGTLVAAAGADTYWASLTSA